MSYRDRRIQAGTERDDESEAWEDDWEPRERPRRSFLGGAFSLLKLAVFVAPLAFFAYGFVADCRTRPTLSSWAGFLGAGACARNEIFGGAASMPDNLAVLRQLIN